MTARPYSECLAQTLALAGIPDANAVETARVKIFLNRRARKAYAESELWPRWLVVGEERIVSDEGLLPYSQDGLQDIGTIYRIHESQPFISDPAGEYVDYNTQSDGVQIARYQPNKSADDMVVTGTLSPDVTGDYPLAGQFTGSFYTDANIYILNGDGSVEQTTASTITVTPPDSGYWAYIDKFNFGGWRLTPYFDGEPIGVSEYWVTFTDGDTPADLTLEPGTGGVSGNALVTPNYPTAFVTYKAALPTTYGDGEGEEDDVPEEWFEYMTQGAYADFLRSDGNPEQAVIEEAIAETMLEQQLAKLSRQNGAHLQTRVLSHANMQSR